MNPPVEMTTMTSTTQMPQTFSFAIQTNNLFQFWLPKGTGKVSVQISQDCPMPIAYVAQNTQLSGFTNKRIILTAVDIVNPLLTIRSTDIQLVFPLNSFSNSFNFQNDQYFDQKQPSLLGVYCPFWSNSNPSNVKFTISTFDFQKTTSYHYYNQFSVLDIHLSLVIQPLSTFSILIDYLPETVYFTFLVGSGVQQILTVNKKQQVTVPVNTEVTVTLKSKNPSLIEIQNTQTVVSRISLSTSVNQGLAGWKIALILVFSVAGGLGLIASCLFVYVYLKRKKKLEYQNAPNELVAKTELDRFATEKNELDRETENNVKTKGGFLSSTPVTLETKQDYPDLEEGQAKGNREEFIQTISENYKR